jgi:molybdopterin-guanine dinucleotide biosynthesis protein A
VPGRLFELLLEYRGPEVDAILPESTGRRGVEPLSAYYSVICLPAVESALDRDDRRMISFHDHVRMVRIPLDVVLELGNPDELFMNLNTPADRTAADRIARDRE